MLPAAPAFSIGHRPHAHEDGVCFSAVFASFSCVSGPTQPKLTTPLTLLPTQAMARGQALMSRRTLQLKLSTDAARLWASPPA